MEVEAEVDLNKSLEIPEDKDIYSVILHNVTQTNFYQIKFPKTIIHLTLNGKMTDLIIPDGIENIECCNMGLHTVHINESLEFLECCDNELETIQLTKNILCVNVRNNKITTVTCREKLDIVNNRVTDLDIDLPQEKMGELCISGNDNIKIKNITFVFADDVTCNFIGGDFLSVYDIEQHIS